MATFWPAAISNTRLEPVPLTDICEAPGPLIVTLPVMSNSPLVRAMVPCNPCANTIVVPGLALAAAMPARRELPPLSLRFVTVKVLSKVRSSNTSKRGMKVRRELTARL